MEVPAFNEDTIRRYAHHIESCVKHVRFLLSEEIDLTHHGNSQIIISTLLDSIEEKTLELLSLAPM